MSETVKVGSREFPVTGYVWSPVHGNVPLVNLPQVSDERILTTPIQKHK